MIDDDAATLDLLRFQLESKKFEVHTAEMGKTGLEFLEKQRFDIILTDLNLPDIYGIDMVQKCKEIAPNTEIIMITGHGSATKAVEATKAGAFYYVEKPYDFDDLIVLIEKAVERQQQAAEIRELRGQLGDVQSYAGIIGGSKPMQNIFQMIENVADSDASILILGESGTGKEVIANAIHYKSNRAKKKFVKVNCSALPKELVESQLFGHEKGAFTGANKAKLGLIGHANEGTLLLDEIGEMPLDLQPKLLRVLQEKQYYKVGSETPVSADFRLVTSTNREPSEAIQGGNLREDLYYRINTIEIVIPPLRERADDIPMLAEHFLKEYAAKYQREIKSFSNSAYQEMLNHRWLGNVRELQHSIERAVLMTKSNSITTLNLTNSYPKADLGENLTVGNSRPSNISTDDKSFPGFPNLEGDSSEEIEEFFEGVGKLIVDEIKEPDDEESEKNEGKDVFGYLEKGLVTAALKKTNGNKRAAASLLGLYRPRLYSMIKRHEIKE